MSGGIHDDSERFEVWNPKLVATILREGRVGPNAIDTRLTQVIRAGNLDKTHDGGGLRA